jgi:hypothetical protein
LKPETCFLFVMTEVLRFTNLSLVYGYL